MMSTKVGELSGHLIRRGLLERLYKLNLISREDNIIFAQKAFQANALVRWAAERAHEGLLKGPKLKKYNDKLDAFLRGELEIKWMDGTPYFIKPGAENVK